MSAPTATATATATAHAVLERLSSSRRQLLASREQQQQQSAASRREQDRALCSSYEHILGCCFASEEELQQQQGEQVHPQRQQKQKQQQQQQQPVASLEDKLLALRRLVVTSGLPSIDFFCRPSSEAASSSGAPGPSLRTCVWKALLGALVEDADAYLALVKLGPCNADSKIRDDTFRTYKNNAEFWEVVSESKLTRVLTATARVLTAHGASDSAGISNVGYVQGMNVLLAPILYVMPSELDAFTCFTALLAKHCPRYILANLEGVHAGCALSEACLEVLDPALHTHLSQRVQLQMEIFMFQYVLTLFANMSQLDQVLRVWDALFAFGVHFNCVLVATHIMLLRDELLQESSAFRVQRLILQTPLDAEVLVGCATRMLTFVPPSLREAMLLHPVEAPSKQTHKISSTPAFKAGLLQKSRSKSNSSLMSKAPDSYADKRSNDTRISYMSVTSSKLLSMTSGNSGERRRPTSAPKSHRKQEGRAGSSAVIVQPRPPSCTISHSRILNPSLLANGSVNGSGTSPRPRPKSAPSSREQTAQRQARADEGLSSRSNSRSSGWVRSIRGVSTVGAAQTDSRKKLQNGDSKRICSKSSMDRAQEHSSKIRRSSPGPVSPRCSRKSSGVNTSVIVPKSGKKGEVSAALSRSTSQKMSAPAIWK